ncbi:hypothetical protein MLD38_037117 [Melastoma candidum]|uniref:Uncharacterized protein n=1 Tax=Melastoma candidum TaxID=119954 RepID=A0ACB9LM83_9MYRT|nr:hypothetical protein MLD38_037117 [Melastoma candidum]
MESYQFGLFATSTIPLQDTPALGEAIQGIPAVDRITFHLLSLRGHPSGVRWVVGVWNLVMIPGSNPITHTPLGKLRLVSWVMANKAQEPPTCWAFRPQLKLDRQGSRPQVRPRGDVVGPGLGFAGL